MKPFERPARHALPKIPTRPHPFFEAEATDIMVRTSHFGEVKTHVRSYGEGPPLVFLHGLMTSNYSARYLFAALGQHYRIIAPDLPGAGRSGCPTEAYTPEALATFVAAWMDAMGLKGVPMIANSMGGYLAMRMCKTHPSRVSHLVNLHSPGLWTPRILALHAAIRAPKAEALLHRLVGRDPETWVFKNVHYYDESYKSEEELKEYAAPLRTAAGRGALVRYLRDTLAVTAMHAFERELVRDAGAFPTKLCLVYAERDPMVPPSVGTRLHKLLPHAEFHWLSEASHFAHVDATTRFVDTIRPFLAAA